MTDPTTDISTTDPTAQDVLDFWFRRIDRALWFAKSEAFDAQIREQFLGVWQRAAQAELVHWRSSLTGRLAEVIVLDQFSRNLFRDAPQAFAQDAMALVLAQEAVAQEGFATMAPEHRHFMLMPYMHSESAAIHALAEPLFAQFAPQALDFELRHKAIVDRFGRYPHRNAVLGRQSTPQEEAFLLEPGSSF